LAKTDIFCPLLVMVSPGNAPKDWDIEVLTTNHNGDNIDELERVRKAHPGEPECIVDNRVLGALAPTRCTSLLPYLESMAKLKMLLTPYKFASLSVSLLSLTMTSPFLHIMVVPNFGLVCPL
jgi:hypothetical protein